MKKSFIATFVLVFLISAGVFANTGELVKESEKYQTVEKNLLNGLESDNFGLRVSSAYYLGEIKSEAAVHKLVSMLRDESDERARLMAALSLVKIGTDQSLFYVKREAKFNDFERVRNICDKLNNAYLLKRSESAKNDHEILASLTIGE